MSSQRLCLCRSSAGISFDRLMHRIARYGTDTMRGYQGYLWVLQGGMFVVCLHQNSTNWN